VLQRVLEIEETKQRRYLVQVGASAV